MHRASPYAPYALKYISSLNSIVCLENVFAGECTNARSFPSSPNEKYRIQINDWAKAKHTKVFSQTCRKPAVSFIFEHLVDLLEDEGPQRRHFFTVCWPTSADHIFIKSNVTLPLDEGVALPRLAKHSRLPHDAQPNRRQRDAPALPALNLAC